MAFNGLRFDWAISHNYRHRVPREILTTFGNRIINCHISLLPRNRGCYPNAWSAALGTASGVTIHRMAEEFDKGDILAQWPVETDPQMTLAESYELLQNRIADLFEEAWPAILNGYAIPHPQLEGEATYYSKNDFETVIKPLLKDGWNTKREALRTAFLTNWCWDIRNILDNPVSGADNAP